jgi:enterochelin esterase-like enzyme
MALTGLPFLILLIAATATLMGATMLLWNRWPWPWVVPMRPLCLLLLMAVGVVLAADIVAADRPAGRGALYWPGAAGPVHGEDGGGHGRVVRVQLDGARSGVRRAALVYLPAAYFQPSQARRRFPVIELFHGYPGGPLNWTGGLHLAQTLDAEIAARRMPPVIAVVPADDDAGHDSECVNAVDGQQDETYLATDVPADIKRDFRVLNTPRAWATIGYSTGGFCAVNIALHHPDRYAAAVALAGYFNAIIDRSTGDLYRGQTAIRRWNSPQWQVAHEPTTVALYLVATRGDPETVRTIASMRRAAHHRSPLVTVTLPTGGHNFHVWYAASPAAFEWLGTHLPTP